MTYESQTTEMLPETGTIKAQAGVRAIDTAYDTFPTVLRRTKCAEAQTI